MGIVDTLRQNENLCAQSAKWRGIEIQPHDGGEGGWSVGETQRHDAEMTEVVIEIMVEASNQIGIERAQSL